MRMTYRCTLVAAGLVLLAFAAQATPANTVIVANDSNPYRADFLPAYAGQIYTTLDAALVKARELDNAGHVTILVIENVTTIGQVTPGSYAANLELIAGDDISIEGYPNISPQHPERVIIQASDTGLPVLYFNGAGSTVTVEGVTLTGGTYGARMNGSSAKLNRCYVRDNSSHGVYIEGASNATLVNCSIVDSGGAGVHVAGGTATIQHGTVKENAAGLVAQGTAGMTIYNSLVVDNSGSGIENGGTGTVTLDYNNVTNNGANLVPGTLNDPHLHTHTPVFADTPWKGKLGDPTANAPLQDANESLAPVTDVDFEKAGRPTSGRTIGADDLIDAGLLKWTQCYVLGPSPIGRVLQGQLNVEIWFDAALAVNDRVYIVPQGAPNHDNANVIPINITTTTNGGVYRGTNAIPITTSLTNGTNVPEVGDRIADGHAVVYLVHSGTQVDPVPDSQAEAGRHLLIDTIPPRVTLETGYQYTADNLVALSSNPSPNTGARGVVFGSALHPYPAPPGSVPQMNAGLLSTVGGTISPIMTSVDEDPKVFFNVNSSANVYGYLELQPIVTVRFDDPDVYAAFGIGAANERQVSGFTIGSFTGDVGNNVLVNGSSSGTTLPCLWRITQGQPALINLPVNLGLTSLGTATDPVSPPFPATDNRIDAAWSFSTNIISEPIADPLHITTAFVARDRAGNLTDVDPDLMERPLHIWWNRGANMQTPVTTSAVPGLFPYAQWSINPSVDTGIEIPDTPPANHLRKLYTYRLWRSLVAGQATGSGGPYEPITTWSAWSDRNVLDPAAFEVLEYSLNNMSPPQTLTDHWLLLTVGSMDEAGNVQPWPAGFDPTAGVTGASGANWTVFFVPGAQTLIDTALTASVLSQEPMQNYGAVSVLQRVIDDEPASFASENRYEVLFDVASIVSSSGPHSVFLSLWVDGEELTVDASTISFVQARQPSRIVLTIECWPDTDEFYTMRLTLGWIDYATGTNSTATIIRTKELARETNFMVSATTREETTGVAYDSTPATYYFKIIPGSVQQYLESSRGEQPVKTFETQ